MKNSRMQFVDNFVPQKKHYCSKNTNSVSNKDPKDNSVTLSLPKKMKDPQYAIYSLRSQEKELKHK